MDYIEIMAFFINDHTEEEIYKFFSVVEFEDIDIRVTYNESVLDDFVIYTKHYIIELHGYLQQKKNMTL
jgi:hypothetical protein